MENEFKLTGSLSIQKGVDGEPSKEMKIAGVASTSAQDFDGEFMDPKGFDLSYFKKFGFINWAHQTNKDPLSIIGRPSKAEISYEKNELFVEATLFKSNEKAVQVYELGRILEAEGHSLAFSIEGKVIKRDPSDPRRVLQAKITGCAITATPKNNDSIANIVKGLDDGDFGLVKGMYSAYDDADEETKKKAMSTESVAPLTKESVGKKPKDTVEGLSKGQVMTILREDLPNTSEDMLEEVYNLSIEIEKSVNMKTPEVSPEALKEAYVLLGIEKGVDAEVPATEPVVAPEPVEEPVAVVEPVIEAPVAEEPVVEDTPEVSPEVIEASEAILKSVGYEVTKKSEEPVVEPVATEEPVIETPAVDFEAILKGQLSELNKGFTDKFEAVGTIVKGLRTEVSEANAKNEALSSELEAFKNASPGRRTVSRSFVEKGASNEMTPSPEATGNTMSVATQKEAILSMADGMCGLTKGTITDHALAESVVSFEQSGLVTDTLKAKMLEKGITLVM